jgi:L-ascorbate metabolism protein UlaG (beta-lactamase superfamily)
VTVSLQWLGQSSFLVDAPEGRIGLDLYISDHLAGKYRGTDKPHDRLHPCSVTAADLADLDWIFASHKHSDHLDPAAIAEIMAAATGATLVLPAPLVDDAADDLAVPRDRMVGVAAGDSVGPFRILPAAHSAVDPSCLSVIVEVDGLRIYHSGDTLVFDEQRAELKQWRPDVVLLPANGRIAEHLGTPPNMSLEEGIELARECEAGLLIPHHYDLFAFNSRDVGDIRRVLADSGVAHRVMEVDETLDVQALLGANM